MNTAISTYVVEGNMPVMGVIWDEDCMEIFSDALSIPAKCWGICHSCRVRFPVTVWPTREVFEKTENDLVSVAAGGRISWMELCGKHCMEHHFNEELPNPYAIENAQVWYRDEKTYWLYVQKPAFIPLPSGQRPIDDIKELLELSKDARDPLSELVSASRGTPLIQQQAVHGMRPSARGG